MILVDSNLLVYAYAESLPQHDASRRWLEGQLNGAVRVGVPWMSILAFLRLVSNPRLFQYAGQLSEAWEKVETWLDSPVVWVPQPTERHREILGRLLERADNPNLVSDAHLAALAIEHGLTLYSADADFARFPGLRWKNPLAK